MAKKRNLKRSIVAIVAVLTTAALVASCSSSKKDSGSTTSAAASSGASGSSSAPPPSGDPFKIGFICQCGVGFAAVDGIKTMNVWVKYTNDNGGINGHPVQLVTAIDPGNPGVALTKVKELVGQDIVALVSSDGSSDAAWMSYMEGTGIPVILTPFGSPQGTLSTKTFSTGVSEFYLRDEVILATKKAGASKLALMYCAEIAVCAAQVTGAKKAVAQYGGVELVYDAAILSSSPNYTAQCLTAKSKGADAMFLAVPAAASLAVASNCAAQGYTPHVVSDEGAYSLAFAGKPGLDGFIGTADNYPFYDFEGIPAMKTFTDAFKKYEPSVLTDPLYGVVTQLYWTMGLLITEAAVKGKVGKENPITPAALFEGIYAVDGTTLGGLTPPLNLKKGEQHENRCWFWTSIEAGKWTTKYGTKYECADKHTSTDGS